MDVNQYAHTAWTLRSGAFRGYPKSLAQSADGYLWVGTDFGVVRFDGVRFVPWEPPAGTHLPSISIVKLLGTRDGSLWIGTVKGLARWKDGKLTHYANLAGHYVTALVEGRDGTVWAAATGGTNRKSRLCAIQRVATRCEADGALGRFVVSLYEDTHGTLWVGAATGLWRWTPGVPRLHSLLRSFSEIRAVAEDEHGSVLVAVNRDIKRLGNQRLETVPFPGAFRPLKPTALSRDREGSLWIGTEDRGIVHVHQGRVDRFTRSDGLTGDLVSTFFEDAEGNMWVGTLTGLDRFRTVAVATMGTQQGLSANTVLSVLGGRDGSVWLGTIAGLNRWKDERITRRSMPQALQREGVASLFEDSRGRLWVSSPRGLVYFEPGSSRSVSVLSKAYVHAMAEDGAENLWVSDQERGLIQLRGRTIVEVISWAKLGGGNARALAADPSDGGLWLGFFTGGVAYFKNGRVQASYSAADGLGGGEISHLRFDSDRALWAASEGGLSRLKGGVVTTLTHANGLPCDSIRWTIEDHMRALWVQTNCGLVRLQRAQLEAWAADPRRTLRMTQYDSSDGVPMQSKVSSYSPSVTRTTDGRLWFASYAGAAVVDPQRLPFNIVVPRVHIEQITADGKTHEPWSVSRLPPLVRDLRIDYTAPSLSAPERVRFRYRLEGRDQNWVEAGNRRQAFYTDLAPGTYRFRVIAANNDGVWNSDGAVWKVVVEAAFYQTAAFKVLSAVIVMIACWSLYRVRVARLAAQLQVRFEERLAERTRIAQELHDTVLQGVLSTSMQLHVMAAQIGDQHMRARLEQVLDRLRQVNGEGRQTLQALRTQLGVSDELDSALGRDAEDFRGVAPIQIRVVVEGRRQPLHPLIADDVYRIGREALVNAFRHASAKHVEIQLQYSDRLRISVRDDGCGIEPSILTAGRAGHWGILGMRERAERIGASLRLMSAPGAGTELELLVPGRIAFQRAAARRNSRWFRRATSPGT